MQVTKIMPSNQETTPAAHKFTQEELQMEFNYMQAERITKKLLERGLITREEFDLIMAENKRTFPTFFITAPLKSDFQCARLRANMSLARKEARP